MRSVLGDLSRSASLLNAPTLHSLADVHEFSFLEGDVRVGAGSKISPGTAVTAASGASVVVNEGCLLLPGVLVEASSGGQVVGPDGARCSVWVSDRAIIAHKAILHSPAFIGKNCFIGFRSTVFNARLGDGCVVMMHALVQDVEVPPGKCVPSGSVIINQHQADQLPNVRPEDLALVREIADIAAPAKLSSKPGSGSASCQPKGRFVSIQSTSGSANSISHSAQKSFNNSSYAREGAHMQTSRQQDKRLAPEIVQQVRQYLAQGYRVGMEHADVRRYRSGVWETCTPIKETRDQAVLEALERCLAEHEGEYVRIFGIDTQVKQRVGMVTVQRPDGRRVNIEAKSGAAASQNGGAYSSNAHAANSNGSGGNSGNSGGLNPEIVQEVRNLLRGGYAIGTEHADARRYRSNVWKSCSPIRSNNEQEVLSRLDHCLAEHGGEYVRMFGINNQAKQRLGSITIQRADGKSVSVSPSHAPVNAASASSSSSYGGGSSYGSSSYSDAQAGGGGLAAQTVSQILAQGSQIGVEYADARRYRSGLWQTAPSVQSINQLQSFLSQNADKYVRIFGVNKSLKTRGSATTVQKPGQAIESLSGAQGVPSRRDPINANPPHYDDPAFLQSGNANSGSYGSGSYGSSSYSDAQAGGGGLAAQTVSQILAQGSQIGVEYADARRYRSGLWQTAPSVQSINQLQSFLSQNADKYVRIFGVNKSLKTRGSATTVQKPGQAIESSSGAQGAPSRRDPINANPPHYDDPAFLQSGKGSGSGAVDSDVMNQVTQLVNQGCRIAVEFADKRRFRSGIWQTGPAIEARRPAEAISALGKQLAQHQGDYVRLVGVDPTAKRRVLETTIQRP